MAAPRRRTRPLPDGTRVDETGRVWEGGGRPRNLDGTPVTAAQMRAELDDPPPPKPKAPRTSSGGRSRSGRGRPTWSGRALGQRTFAPVRVDTDATGFVLALMFWGWVVLPVLKADSPADGPRAVANVLRAKFFNKGPNGEWLT